MSVLDTVQPLCDTLINVCHTTPLYPPFGDFRVTGLLQQISEKIGETVSIRMIAIHALPRAVHTGDEVDVIKLLRLCKDRRHTIGPDPIGNTIWNGIDSPIHVAVKFGYITILRHLIRSNICGTMYSQNSIGWTPLHVAARFCQHNCAALLLSFYFGSPNMVTGYTQCRDPVDGYYANQVEMSRLPDCVGCVNTKDHRGSTPLHVAAGQRDLATINLLLCYGASVDPRDMHQRTPLYYAATNYYVAGIRRLILQGANVSITDIGGSTPLHAITDNHMCMYGNDEPHSFAFMQRGAVDSVKLLLEQGADIRAEDHTRITPYTLSHPYSGIRFLFDEMMPLIATKTRQLHEHHRNVLALAQHKKSAKCSSLLRIPDDAIRNVRAQLGILDGDDPYPASDIERRIVYKSVMDIINSIV